MDARIAERAVASPSISKLFEMLFNGRRRGCTCVFCFFTSHRRHGITFEPGLTVHPGKIGQISERSSENLKKHLGVVNYDPDAFRIRVLTFFLLPALCLFAVANGDNVATFIVTCGIVTGVPTHVSPLCATVWGRCCGRRSNQCSGACSISSSAHVRGAQEEV
jgi:hypothetical protein